MDHKKQLEKHIITILTGGLFCLAIAFVNLPFAEFNLHLLLLTAFTLGFGSRITIRIPQFKSHVSVSDTFIFLALMLYGGEVAIVLAALDAVISSARFCRQKIIILSNGAMVALSTTAVVVTLKSLGLYEPLRQPGSNNFNELILALFVMGSMQFVVNTTMTAIYGAIKSEQPVWEIWKTKFLWLFITYFVGAITAGILNQLNYHIGFVTILLIFPVVFLLYQTYKIYLHNVEISVEKVNEANEYAEKLKGQTIALRASEERFRSAFNFAPIGIAIVSPEGKWLKVNRALCEILGYEEIEFLASDFQSMAVADDLGLALVKLHEILTGEIPNCRLEQRYLHKTGRIVWTQWSVSPAADTAAERPNLIFQIHDITDKKETDDKLLYDATHDALTGLSNRACFMERLERGMIKSRENPLHKISLLFIDLDRFKVINDSLGHLLGDRLLIEIARRLCECMRPHDTVARLGGDEFTILVEGNHEPEEVTKIADRIQQKLADSFDLGGHKIYSSASIGILHNSKKYNQAEDLMRDADTAMYQAKRAGKACYKVFNDRMHTAVKEVLLLETELRRAIENDDLSVYFQPICSLASGEIEGFEALARWEHRDSGMIAPHKFISLAEEIGLIDKLGGQILSKACRQIRLLNEETTARPPYFLSVNLSCKQFSRQHLAEEIKAILDAENFSPHLLKTEITESVFFDYKESATRTLTELRAYGIEISIDDFGTGYSNLSYLTQLPISTLKIDRSFITPLEKGGGGAQVVRAIILLAQNLGLRVIAEGVENNVQLEHLKMLGCDSVQGFYFAEPMNFESIRRFIAGRYAPVAPDSFGNLPVMPIVQ